MQPLGVMLLLSALTLGIYKYLWFAQLADRLYNNAERYDLEPGWDGEALCLWIILVPFIGVWIALALLIQDANRLSRAYNAQVNRSRSFERTYVRPSVPLENAAAAVSSEKKKQIGGSSIARHPGGAAPRGGMLGVAGDYKDMRVPLEPGEQLILGRDPKRASVVLEGNKISRVHCIIARKGSGQGYLVTNCSKNGIELNGQNILSETPVDVGPGSKVSLDGGNYIFKLL